MSHITIIISKVSVGDTTLATEAPEVSYEYAISIPHDATPDRVAKLVRQAYQRLEGPHPRTSDE